MQQAIIFIHGIGQQEKGLCKGSQEKIRKQLRKENKNAGEPIFIEACWSSILKQRQESLVQLTEKVLANALKHEKIPAFYDRICCDAIAYQNDAVGKETYTAIHQVISDVNSARKKAEQRAHGEPVEFTFVAHSLGTVITLKLAMWIIALAIAMVGPNCWATNLFTLGSPIAPLWLLRYGNPEDATATLQVQRPEGAWINIYDNEDIIGFLLKAINKAYDEAVDYDYNTGVGGLTSVGTPVSHIHYLTDHNVVAPIANKLWRDQQRANGNENYDRAAYLKTIRKLWNW